MRIIRRFTLSQIEMASEVGAANLQRFVRALVSAGYVRVERARVNGRPDSRNVYQLIRNTGPKAPIIGNDGNVFDENTRELFTGSGQVCSAHAIANPEPETTHVQVDVLCAVVHCLTAPAGEPGLLQRLVTVTQQLETTGADRLAEVLARLHERARLLLPEPRGEKQ